MHSQSALVGLANIIATHMNTCTHILYCRRSSGFSARPYNVFGIYKQHERRFTDDDNLMHISSNSDETNKNILNSDLGIMKTWADQWLIKFSVEKNKIYVC